MKLILKSSLFVIIAVLLLTGCSDEKPQNAEELLKDPKMQKELMTAISNDDQMMTNMLDHITQSDQGMQMMKGNQKMMQQMIDGGGMDMMNNMMDMAKSDTSSFKEGMGRMMDDGQVMGIMMEMMHERGYVSDVSMMKGEEMMKQ